jgi:1,2-diacylglycerol 3-beta-galactosyltransferase
LKDRFQRYRLPSGRNILTRPAREKNQVQRKKRILFLVADLGYGHRSAANAIVSALKEQYGDTFDLIIENPLEHERTPGLLRSAQAQYDTLVKEMADLYKLQYWLIGTPVGSVATESALVLMLVDAMNDILKQVRPDVIVCVQENFLAPLNLLFGFGQPRVPVITVVTDLTTLHRLWFNEVSSVCVVPTQEAYNLALGYGFPQEKLRLLGIPVNPQFTKTQGSLSQRRAALGWDDLTTVLIVGGKRVRNLSDLLRVINHSALPIQLAVVAGGDDDLYNELNALTWHRPAKVYSYVDNMPDFMHAADMIICKAGGLIVSEALACGLPILLADVIEGQETGNSEYVTQGGAAERALDAIQALEVLFHWLDNDRALLAERAMGARALGRPNAAYEIAELITTLIKG